MRLITCGSLVEGGSVKEKDAAVWGVHLLLGHAKNHFTGLPEGHLIIIIYYFDYYNFSK